MFVATAKVLLDYYGNEDPNSKRPEMKKLSQSIHRKFNVSALEIIEKVDDPERCVLGLSLVARSRIEARATMDQVLKFVDESSFARVTSEDVEIFQIE